MPSRASDEGCRNSEIAAASRLEQRIANGDHLMKSAALVLAIAVAIVLSAHAVLGKGTPVVRVEGKPIDYPEVAQGYAHFQADQRAARFRAIDHLAHHE
jgi:hypothetical protein